MAHDHSHSYGSKNYGKAFAIGIGLNVTYIAVEVFYGLSAQSSVLLADAGHNTSDVLSLLLVWAATWVAEKHYTYGLRKTTVMVSLINGGVEHCCRWYYYLGGHSKTTEHVGSIQQYDVREKLHERFEITHTTLQVEKSFDDDAYRPYKD